MPPKTVAIAIALQGWIEPAEAFASVVADSSYGFWLDGGPGAREGWSWLGVGVPEPAAEAVRAVDVSAPAAIPGDAGAFHGGWVGWVGYETGAAAGGAPVAPGGGGEHWLRVDDFLAFDHARRRVWAWSATAEGAARLARTTGRSHRFPEQRLDRAASVSRHSPAQYAALVEKCRDEIREGNAYLLCLTTRFDVAGAFDPVAVHHRLRAGSPSHHGALVRGGATALVSASPERFLEVRAGVVRTHPIKGTRPRAADEETDAALAAELRADPKERAENVMIVDLMRNDLSRICTPATVTVQRLLEIESYPAVHQLVSTVAGVLAPGTTLGELLDAAFPAGSMTGAPKLSAMTILHELEGAPRGVFSGCYGWVGDDGDADLAMVIRSVVVGPDAAYVGAGGGITWHSKADAEVREVGWKARAPLAALGAELPPGW